MLYLSFPLFLAKKGNYFSVVATFGGSLLSGVVTFGTLQYVVVMAISNYVKIWVVTAILFDALFSEEGS